MAKKNVNYFILHGKHSKNTVATNVLEGFLASVLELASGIGTGKFKKKYYPGKRPQTGGAKGDETSGGDDDDNGTQMRAKRSRHMRAHESTHVRAHI